MASKKSKASAKSFVFVGLMLASLIVSVVGLFLSFATTESFKNILTGKTESFTIGLFSLESTAGVFTIIFAILAVVLALALIGVTLYTSLTGKKAKINERLLKTMMFPHKSWYSEDPSTVFFIITKIDR